MYTIEYAYNEADGENSEVDDREMGGNPVGKRTLAHVREILHEIPCSMTEDSGKHCEEGEEEGRPVGYVGEEEVVDIDTTLGGKGEIHQEQHNQHGECQGWFEW